MSGKILGPIDLVVNADISANFAQTNGADMLLCTVGCIVLRWTGNPVGTFSVDGSLDGTTWYPTNTEVNNPTGSPDSTMINLIGVGFRYLRISYTAVSGTGVLNAKFFGKGGGESL